MGERMDVVDLIINVLKEHEETLDKLVTRLEQGLDQTRIYDDDHEPEEHKQESCLRCNSTKFFAYTSTAGMTIVCAECGRRV